MYFALPEGAGQMYFALPESAGQMYFALPEGAGDTFLIGDYILPPTAFGYLLSRHVNLNINCILHYLGIQY